jgi:hypothetical protein
VRDHSSGRLLVGWRVPRARAPHDFLIAVLYMRRAASQVHRSGSIPISTL